MSEELSKHQPEEILDQVEKFGEFTEQAEKWLEETTAKIHQTEKDCLTRIFTRFSIKKVKFPDFSKVSEKKYPSRPNYTEYWYKQGTQDAYFLMAAELKVVDNNPILDVYFNEELTYNNEL